MFKFGRQSNLLPLSVVRHGDVDGDDKRRLLFVISGSFSIKASTLYLNSDLAKVVKTLKTPSLGIHLV